MSNKLSCNLYRQPRVTNLPAPLLLACVFVLLLSAPQALAGDAPQWMHALVNAPLATYDEKTDAVLLYSETNVTVLSADKIKTRVREAYKILRPEGRYHGTAIVYFNSHKKVTSLHGWCILAQGKDFEVKDKDAAEVSLPNIQGSELITDVKAKVLHIPALLIRQTASIEWRSRLIVRAAKRLIIRSTVVRDRLRTVARPDRALSKHRRGECGGKNSDST